MARSSSGYSLLVPPVTSGGGSASNPKNGRRTAAWTVVVIIATCILLSAKNKYGEVHQEQTTTLVPGKGTFVQDPASLGDFTNFPRAGLKHELWQQLDTITNWEVTINPVSQVWKAERNPKKDKVFWSTSDLLGRTHELPTFPRKPVVPSTASRPDSILFGVVTTAARARKMSELWTRWMVPPRTGSDSDMGRPRCLVMLSEQERNETESLTAVLRGRGLDCDVAWSREERYEVRVLSMAREMPRYARHKNIDIDWYVWNDDDTFWLDEATMRRMLAKHDPADPLILGATSEAANQINTFGRMAFGGAGIIVSKQLMADMESNYGECWERWRGIFGGDEMVTRCAALAMGPEWTKSTVTTEEPGLHQFDIPGDSTGIFQAGLPLLNLHHYLGGGWVHLFGYGLNYVSEFEQIRLMKKVATFLGGDNLFERYVFNDGKWLFVNGYSITIFEEALTPDMLRTAEHTWYADYRLSIDDRPEIPERHDDRGRAVKQTFYIEDLILYDAESEQAKSGTRATLVYASADKWDEDVPKSARRRICVHWNREQPRLAASRPDTDTTFQLDHAAR